MGEFVHLPQTLWTQISAARRLGGSALDDLLRRYRAPVYAFIRTLGIDAEAAEDLTQESFLRIIEDDVLARADRAAGKFRSFLLAVVRHTVADHRRGARRLKRGGGVRHVPLDGPATGPTLDVAALLAAPATHDEGFDTLWIQNLIRLAMERLRDECAGSGKPYHEALALLVDRQMSCPEIAAALAMSRANLKTCLHQARLRLKRFVLEEIRRYSSTRSECKEEGEYLSRFLK